MSSKTTSSGAPSPTTPESSAAPTAVAATAMVEDGLPPSVPLRPKRDTTTHDASEQGAQDSCGAEARGATYRAGESPAEATETARAHAEKWNHSEPSMVSRQPCESTGDGGMWSSVPTSPAAWMGQCSDTSTERYRSATTSPQGAMAASWMGPGLNPGSNSVYHSAATSPGGVGPRGAGTGGWEPMGAGGEGLWAPLQGS
eukprot:4724949-Pyramimonas_sp.AAC.1